MSIPDLPNKKYGVIYVDPPWEYRVWDKATGQGRSAETHYRTMELDEIKSIPVATLAYPNCALLIWSVSPSLPAALEVIEAWGFKYQTVAFCWVKKTKNGKDHFGMGHYTRANIELCLLATRGNITRADASVRQLRWNVEDMPIPIEATIREHSRKPDEIRDAIVQLFGSRRSYLEMFARAPFDPRFDTWGVDGYQPKPFVQL